MVVITETTTNILRIFGYFPVNYVPPKLNKIPIQFIKNYATFGAHIMYSVQTIGFFLYEADDFNEYQGSLFGQFKL